MYDETYPFLREHLERQEGVTDKLLGPVRAWNEYVLPLTLPRGSRVLDVGACTGSLMNKLQWVGGYEMYGVDLNDAAIKAGLEMYDDPNLYLATAECLPFPDDSFDGVISQDLLEHIPKDSLPLALAEFRRVSRGTRMVHKVTVTEDTEWIDSDHTHVTKQNAEWWLMLFESEGFRVLVDPHKKYLDRWKCFPVLKDMHGYYLIEAVN